MTGSHLLHNELHYERSNDLFGFKACASRACLTRVYVQQFCTFCFHNLHRIPHNLL